MAETTVLRNLTLPVRTDPLTAPTPQTLAPWPEVLAAAGMAFQLVATPGQVTCVVAEAPAASAAPTEQTPRARRVSAKG